MRLNPVYQVDWQNVAAGKVVKAAKRRIRWRFGFSNKKAIAEGLTGVECRGEEHEVTLVWSLTSGKRIVIADGREVHFSKRVEPKFETTWTMKGGHTIKVVAYASPPASPAPGFKQFDLLIDGFSFFKMPRIFELGTSRANKLAVVPAQTAVPQAYSNYCLPAQAVSPSERSSHYMEDELRSSHSATSSNSSRGGSGDSARIPIEQESPDLLDLLSGAPEGQDYAGVQTVVAAAGQHRTANHVAHSVVAPPAPTYHHTVYHQNPAHNTSPYLALANESHTHFAQSQTNQSQQQAHYYQQNYYVQQPQAYQQYHHQPVTQTPNRNQYQQAPAVVSPDSPIDKSQSVSGRDQPPVTPKVLTMEQISVEEIEERQRSPVSDIDRAFTTLVNLDDISEIRKTPEQRKSEKMKTKNIASRSKPLPPTAPEWHLGMNPKLGEIKANAPAKAPPKKEIMRTHAFDPAAAAAGMMVVYGATTTQQSQQYYAQQQRPLYAAY